MVFQRRAGEGQLLAGADAARRLCGLGPGILELLRLVADEQGKFLPGERVAVAGEQGIGGDDDVEVGDGLQQGARWLPCTQRSPTAHREAETAKAHRG